ncbi:MAG TPA: hypothetical protein VFS21_24195 [Roseiflexaceae bacterium]|nr:hypothetical protein [Roseiflexaceae bacterium]
MKTPDAITEAELAAIEARVEAATPGPWVSYIEGRDVESGSSFIMTGEEDGEGEDLYMLRAPAAHQDFIAAARQDIPKLIAEVRRLWRLLEERGA